jgi:hypothetical protein
MKLFWLFVCVTVAGVVAAQNEPSPSSAPDASDETAPREYLGFLADNTFRGVIDDPDGYVNVRARADAKSPIVAKVKTGERFTFQRHEYDPWCSVKLASGKTGWMDAQRILLFFTKDDLPVKPEADDTDRETRRHGFDFYEAVQGAVRGDFELRKKFFQVGEFADGAAAEGLEGLTAAVIHLIGDDALAAFLRTQPIQVQTEVRNSIGDPVTRPFRASGYLQHHFPKSSKIFFRREITDWPSPDGKYAFHKVFSDEYTDEDSIVTRSELIDKASGKRVLDLTREDHGFGGEREGDIEWSPDSKGFLFTTEPTRDKPETRLYFWSGKSFTKIDLPHDNTPPRDPDPKVAGATYDGVGKETIHWSKPATLVCERTYYYKKSVVPDSPYIIDQKYEITMAIGADGKLTTETKRLDEP